MAERRVLGVGTLRAWGRRSKRPGVDFVPGGAAGFEDAVDLAPLIDPSGEEDLMRPGREFRLVLEAVE